MGIAWDDYRRHDAVGLAALVAAGEVSATELLEAATDRADAVEPTINAIRHRMTDAARARARGELSGPFAGVPFLVKDLAQHIAGVPTGSGSRALAGYPRPETSTVVRRWTDAGLVIFGRTATPEFGARAVTEPVAGGPTRNPWDPGRTPGGSSGGAAAAVAAGIVPAAGASDGGGSIRIPAAACGLFGLKPGRGVVPSGPEVDEGFHGAAVQGVVSRTVRDSAAMLDVLAGPAPEGPYRVQPPERPYAEAVRDDPAPLRIGLSTASPLGGPVDPEAVAAVTGAAELLSSLGHVVEESAPAVDGRRLATDFLTTWFAMIAAQVDGARARTGCGEDAFETETRVMAAIGRGTSAPEYLAAQARWQEHTRALATFHERYDLLLTPTLARPPWPIGELDLAGPVKLVARGLLTLRAGGLLGRMNLVEGLVDANFAPVPFTQLANLTGRPAATVPLHTTAGGLPLGVQFVGRPGAEPQLLALAAQLERARPWADRMPAL
ncbi:MULTISPECIES: amidase [Pseudonocardia]|uniref:6-aminohexanoate-cyclic-dimer hydrolase n=2 Tax=Pseudonocardia TaxID=1847 RepID=A0A1Y2MLN0_PSEAH|nr:MULTISPECIES: amidase [Pseudonocardia]OSY35889.1 6-aminohexanoate-cyclic-dimer hydrolase [Pseudonocardia autotrophica]TDN74002.1 Asp-tRNA(Asn)/Glu-tRNA(Gln) amidotransferase A subunit family amidase [Pseudonocardia autotrophica]BBG04759.1 amidase [Pseudonocardia autotrophica]GEC28697.1 amidase [Pseudonocardia saturnea]